MHLGFALDEKRRKRSPEFFFVCFLFFRSHEWAYQSQGLVRWGRKRCVFKWWGYRVRNKGLGVFGSEKLIWQASWPRPRRQSRSPCHWGRCWWTPRACRRCSGISRWLSSLWGCRSLCTSLPPPGEGLSNVRNLFKSWAAHCLRNRNGTEQPRSYTILGFLFVHSPTTCRNWREL